MNWEQIQGQWSEWKGRLKERWGIFVADFELVLDGRRDQQHGRRLGQHGWARRQAEERFSELCGQYSEQQRR